jgi:hypothetical protein
VKSNFTCLGLRASGLAQKRKYGEFGV